MPAEPPPEPPTESIENALPRTDATTALGGATLPRTEEELNAPTPLTLRLLAVMFIATFLPWVGAKAACNLRDAPARPPLELPAAELAKTPKGAALELQQRAASHQYREASELAKGELAAELLAADARCQAEPKPCEERRAQRDKLFTRAVLATRGPSVAHVRAQTLLGDQVLEKFAMRLSQEDGRWYVVSRTPLAGEITDPVQPHEVVSPFEIRRSADQQPHSPHGVVIQGAAASQSPQASPAPTP
jgi:hypothetical protein